MRAEVNHLYRIPPPNDEDRPPKVVAQEVIRLYREDFSITIKGFCSIFQCERKWAEEYIVPNVLHIFVTRFFGRYIVDTMKDSLSPKEQNDFYYRMYFISKKNLISFYKTNASAFQKTSLIDIVKYRKTPSCLNALLTERNIHQKARASASERTRHLERMKTLLTPEGYQLYLASLSIKNNVWEPVALPKIPFQPSDTQFITTAQAIKRYNLSSNTSVYNYMERNGAIKVKFGGKILWFLQENDGRWLIPQQYRSDSATISIREENH